MLLSKFQSSLTYPIAAILVLVTVVPVALVGYSLADYNREHLMTLEKQSLTRQAVNLANEASVYLAAQRNRLDGIVWALRATASTKPEVQAELLRQTAERSNRAFLYLQIADSEGAGAFVRDPGLSDDLASRLATPLGAVHREALEGNQTSLLMIDLPKSYPAVEVLGLPFLSANGTVQGSLTAVLDLTPVQRRLMESATGGQYVTFFDQGGRVIIASRPNLKGVDISSSPLVADFKRSPVRLTRVFESADSLEKELLVGSVAGVEGSGWGIIVERSMADAFAPVRGMLVRTVVVSGLAGLVALAIGFLLAGRLIRPIQELDTVSSQIAEGNLTVRAPVSGSDEIAHLARNFNRMAGSVDNLVRRLKQALRQNQELFLATIRTLAAAIDAKDPYTRGHSERVSSFSMAIARHLGLNQEEVFRVRIASILHDVGKLGIQDGILNKPAGLTSEEFEIMQQHPAIGAQIMAPIPMLKDIIPGIRNHHETWDGNGYPDGLAGEEIPLVARIIAAADTFDAMTTTRPYQKAMSLSFVLEKMRAMSGTRFAPDVIDALVAAVETGDISQPESQRAQSVSQQEVS